MTMRQALREVIDIAELKVRIQTAEQAMTAARELLSRLDERLEEGVAPRPDSEDPMEGQTQGTRLIPLVEWPNYHPWPKLGGLRHLVFHAKENGFDKVIRKIGDRILVDERAFFAWAEQQSVHQLPPETPAPTRRSQARRANRR